jgi:hypothetical protein
MTDLKLQYTAVQRKLDLLVKKFDLASMALEDQLLAIRKQCTHQHVTNQHTYTSGGYDYPSETRRWTTCDLCMFKSTITITTR